MRSTPRRRRLISHLLPQIIPGLPRGPRRRARCAAGPPWWRRGRRRIRVQRFADQVLGDVGPVGVGGVEELHAQFDRAAQHAHASSWSAGGPQMPLPVSRIAPKPSRLTDMSPPTSTVPACAMDGVVTGTKLYSGGAKAEQGEADRPRHTLVDLHRRWRHRRTHCPTATTICSESAVIGHGRPRFTRPRRCGDAMGHAARRRRRGRARPTEVAEVGSEVLVGLGPIRAPCRVVLRHRRA